MGVGGWRHESAWYLSKLDFVSVFLNLGRFLWFLEQTCAINDCVYGLGVLNSLHFAVSHRSVPLGEQGLLSVHCSRGIVGPTAGVVLRARNSRPVLCVSAVCVIEGS